MHGGYKYIDYSYNVFFLMQAVNQFMVMLILEMVRYVWLRREPLARN